jgi:SAM-dependent methyltransferase
MTMSRNPWDENYLCRGRLWGGSASSFPHLPCSSRILELGCGDGKTVSMLVQQGYHVTAIDFSGRAVFLCRNTCPYPDRVRIAVADVRQIPFRNESFDGIIASHITGHLDGAGRRQHAVEVNRLLAPGGILHFRDFSAGDFRSGQGEETEDGTFLKKNGITTHYFTGDEVRALFAGLCLQSLVQHEWAIQIRGKVFPRAEIVAQFIKPA